MTGRTPEVLAPTGTVPKKLKEKNVQSQLNRYIKICSKCAISADYLLGKIDSPKYLK